jgi:hypothetical protein
MHLGARVRPVVPSMPEDLRATLVRILAYMGGLAIIAIVAASLFRTPPVEAAIDPSGQPKWVNVERPYPAFELLMPEFAGLMPDYAILRRAEGNGRKDVLTWGSATDNSPYVMVEVYRPGSDGERFIDAPSEIAARIVNYSVTDDVKPAGTIDSKFGPVSLVDFALARNSASRRCLGFARAVDDPNMQIAGWYCSAGAEVVDRSTLACAIDRLTLVSAGSDPALAAYFARAELKRKFCGQRNPILAATPRHSDLAATPSHAKLRGRIRSR